MALRALNGFQLSGHLHGTVAPPAHRYQKSIVDSADGQIFIGDPVALTSAGTVTRLHLQDQLGGIRSDSLHPIGVCTGIFETENGRPLTHRTRKYAATADAFWIDVIDGPDVVWEVSIGISANQTRIGSLAGQQYASANQTAGISGAGITSSAWATVSGVITAPWRIIGIVNLNRDGQTNDHDGRVRVVHNNHVWRKTTED